MSELAETFNAIREREATRNVQRSQVASANRQWMKQNMPVVTTLFDALQAAGMQPKLVKLEKSQ